MLIIQVDEQCRTFGGMMVKDLRSLIPLLTISRGGTTVRYAAWPTSIRSQGKLYEPFLFMFVLDEWDRLTTWKRIKIYLDHSAIAAAFPAPFPGESLIKAVVQVVTERDHEGILRRFDGALRFENDKIYFEPVRLAPPA
jgi:hypothetical protein